MTIRFRPVRDWCRIEPVARPAWPQRWARVGIAEEYRLTAPANPRLSKKLLVYTSQFARLRRRGLVRLDLASQFRGPLLTNKDREITRLRTSAVIKSAGVMLFEGRAVLTAQSVDVAGRRLTRDISSATGGDRRPGVPGIEHCINR
jgi:hypothetical protein